MALTVFADGRVTRARTIEDIDFSCLAFAACESPNGIATLFAQRGFSFFTFHNTSHTYGFAHRAFTFYAQPKKSHSPGSQALYLAEYRLSPTHILILQCLPPSTITSRHFHIHKTEIYHQLLGQSVVEVDGIDFPLAHASLTIEPRRVHQTRTLEQAALTLLEIIGPGDPLQDDHHYVLKNKSRI